MLGTWNLNASTTVCELKVWEIWRKKNTAKWPNQQYTRRKKKSTYSFPSAELIMKINKHVNAVRSNRAQRNCTKKPNDITGMIERIGHCENARAKSTLQQMYNCFVISIGKLKMKHTKTHINWTFQQVIFNKIDTK